MQKQVVDSPVNIYILMMKRYRMALQPKDIYPGPLPDKTDIYFMRAAWWRCHSEHNVAQHVDLRSVVPIVNLNGSKLIPDHRGHSREAVMDSVVRSMGDYINTSRHNFLAPTSIFNAFRQ